MTRKWLVKTNLTVLTGLTIIVGGLTSHGLLFTQKTFGDLLSQKNHELLKRKSSELAKLAKKYKLQKNNKKLIRVKYKECNRLWHKQFGTKVKQKTKNKLENWCVTGAKKLTD